MFSLVWVYLGILRMFPLYLEIPTCLSARITNEVISSHCDQPTMFISSLSRLNFPESPLPEHWTIKVQRHSIHLKILYFNVRCYTGIWNIDIKQHFEWENILYFKQVTILASLPAMHSVTV